MHLKILFCRALAKLCALLRKIVWTVGDYAFLDIMDEDSAMLEARVVQVLWCDKETGQETQVEQGVEIAKGVLSERDAAMQPQGSFMYVVQIEGTNKRVRKSGKQLFFQDELSLRLLFSPEHRYVLSCSSCSFYLALLCCLFERDDRVTRAIGHFLRSVTGDYLALAIRPFLIAYCKQPTKLLDFISDFVICVSVSFKF